MNRSRCERGRLLDPQSFREAGDPAGHPDYRPGGSSRLSIVARAASTGNVTLQSPAAIGRIHSSVRSLSARARSQPPADGRALADDGALWISWPKKSSGVESDLNENVIRDQGL